jgi:hypothetical protein
VSSGPHKAPVLVSLDALSDGMDQEESGQVLLYSLRAVNMLLITPIRVLHGKNHHPHL